MPLAKLKPVETARTAFPLPADLAHAAAAPSPARLLQQRLAWATMAGADAPRWSLRRSTAFVTVTSCALWMAILTATTQAAHAVA